MTVSISQWKNAVSGSFNVAANWSTGSVPGTSSDAYLDATGSSYTVTSSANNSVDALYIDANATLNLSAGIFTVYSAANAQTDAGNQGAVDIGAGARLAIGQVSSPSTDFAIFFNFGAVALASTAALATLAFYAPDDTLRGGGTVTLSGKAQILAGGSAATLHNRDNTISGSGTIGSANLTFNNDRLGVVDATASSALVLNTGTNAIGNSGTIETTGAGGLTIDSTVNDQGKLVAAGTGALTVANATVTGGGDIAVTAAKAGIKLSNGTLNMGGIISTVAGGSIVGLAGTTNTIENGDLKNAGSIIAQNGSTLILDVFIDGAGTLQAAGSSSRTTIEIGTYGSTLQGGAKLILTDSADNAVVSTGAQAQLINRAGTISGSGTIGDVDLRFVNLTNGTVDSNGKVGLTIVGDSASGENSDYNSGLIETTGAGGLTIEGIFGNAGTVMAAGPGALTLNGMTSTNGGLFETATASASMVLENGTTISGGSFETAAGSTVTVAAGSTTSILETNLNNGAIVVANGSTLVATDNHWDNTGTISLEGASAATKWEIGSASGNNMQLTGGGTVDLANGAEDSIVSNGSAATLRNIDNTIEGAGTIGDANLTVQNQADGVIDADGSGGMTLSTGSNYVFNDGSIISDNAVGITIDGSLNNHGLLISNSGNLDVIGAVYNDGVAEINNGGEIEFNAASSNDVAFGSGADGTLRLDNSSTAADAYTGTISGFAGQDSIDLSDIAYVASGTSGTSLSYSGGTAGLLTVSQGTHSTTLALIGAAYTQGSFVLSSDQHGGTLVKL